MKALVGRVMAMPPRLQDLLLAVALTVLNVGTLAPYYGRLPRPELAFAFVVMQSLPLIWRQSLPVTALAVIGAARVGYDYAIAVYAPLPLGPAIGFYTVMKRSRPVLCWVSSGVALVAILLSQRVPGHNEPYDFFIAALIIAVAGMAGLLSRARQQYLAEAEARAARAESDRDRDAAAAAARERARIARELHDVVAHHVSLMAVQAEAAASLLPGQPDDARRSVEVIGDTARQALSELRRLLGVLRGPAEDPGTPPSRSLADIGTVIDQVREAGLAVELRVEGEPGALAPGIGLTAYRIIQEALTNTIRHSAAASATVTLSYEPDHITVQVADTGQSAGDPLPAGVPSPAGAPWSAGEAALDRDPEGLQRVHHAEPVAAGRPAGGTGPDAPPVTDGRLPGGAGPGEPPGQAGGLPPRAARRLNGLTAAAGAVTAAPGRQPGERAARPGRRHGTAGAADSGGFGLAGIAERVASCGGSLTVGPTGSGGFAVVARLPAL